MPLETELKLRLDPHNVPALLRHPLLKGGTRRSTRRLRSVYFDTPALDLWRAGVSLRIRHDGDNRIQTVKFGGGVTGGLHERHEIDTRIAHDVPDFAALAAGEAAAHFASHELRAHLKPLLVTDFRRTSVIVKPAAGVAIEVCIDRGTIGGGDTHEPLCEVEFEMKSGPAWRAHQFALRLMADLPLLVEDRSKALRGMDLLTGREDEPVKSGRSPLAPVLLTGEAFKQLIAACLAHFIANQRGMLETNDPEYLHQMRVALRRMRSVFATFAPLFPPEVLAPPVAEMRWLGASLGDARDWDVFRHESLPPLVARYPRHAGLTALQRSTARMQQRAKRRARIAVASTRGQGLLLGLSAWISAETWREALDDAQLLALHRPAVEFARDRLDALSERVLKRGRRFGKLAPRELHKLRIAAKQLRYAAEFFAPLFDDPKAGAYRATLARLQDVLGTYNDAVKVAHCGERAASGLSGTTVSEARGLLLGWSAGIEDMGSRELKPVWKNFCAENAFWR